MPKKYLTVNEVAQIMGVTPLTVRNWDKKGRLIAHRHPVNNYRLYRVEDVENLFTQIENKTIVSTAQPGRPVGPKKLKIELL